MSKHDLGTAHRFKEFRKKFLGNNMNDAAKVLELSISRISRIENAEDPIPVKTISFLVKKHNLNRDWLFDNKGNPQKTDTTKKTGLQSSIEMGDRIDMLKTQILILSKNLSKAWQIIERHEKEIDRQAKEIEKLQDGSR